MADTQPELAARLLLDMVAVAVEDDNDEPLEQFLAAIADDPRIVDAESARSVLTVIADVAGPVLPVFYRKRRS